MKLVSKMCIPWKVTLQRPVLSSNQDIRRLIMKVKITASCLWKVNEEDEEIANDLLRDEPKDIVLDYLQDALIGNDGDLTNFEVSIEEVT